MKLTNEDVDKRVSGKLVKRLEDVNGSLTKITWQCLVENCNYMWKTTPSHFINQNGGCPKCSKKSRSTNEDIDQKIKERNLLIKRIDNYFNMKEKIRWQCLKEDCNYIWKSTTDNTLRNKGCPKCNHCIKLNNDIVDERLKNKLIKRIGDYVNNYIKINWKCLKIDCNYIWISSPANILAGYGCPKCAGTLPLNNSIIDDRLGNRPIKRLDTYLSINKKIKWQCIVDGCDYIWSATPSHILGNRKTGCPKCAGHIKLNDKIIDDRLEGRNIKRVENYINNHTRIKWQCAINTCNYIWITSPNVVVNNKGGCPKCAGQVRLSNDIVDDKLKDRNIKRIGNYKNIDTKIEWQCLKIDCNNVWKTSPYCILNRFSGCPVCFNKNEKLIFQILKENDIDFEYQKSIKKINYNEKNLYKFDFYISRYNLIIEYNGKQHYEPVCFGGVSEETAEINLQKQTKRDEYVRYFCKINHIKLLEIDGRKYHNNKLKEYILELINNNFDTKERVA